MPSFKGNERPLSEACWRLSDPSATSGLCSSFGKRGRTSRQSFCVDPCLPVESSDEAVARWGSIRSWRRTLLYARARVSDSRRRDGGYAGNRFAPSSPCSSASLKNEAWLGGPIQSRTDAPRKGSLARAGAAIGLKEHPSSAAIVLGRPPGRILGPSSASWRLPCQPGQCGCFGRTRAARPRRGRRRSQRSPGGGSGARGGGCRCRWSQTSSRRRRPPQERGHLLGEVFSSFSAGKVWRPRELAEFSPSNRVRAQGAPATPPDGSWWRGSDDYLSDFRRADGSLWLFWLGAGH